MSAHRRRVETEPFQPLGVVDRAERILIGVERHLGVDHQRTPTRHADDRVRSQARTFVANRDAHLRLEVGVLTQPAGFEHILQLLLTPAAARLGRVAERIDQLGGFGGNLLLAQPHLLDLPLQVAERVAALGLDLCHTFFIALQAIADGLEHRLEILTGAFLRLAKAGVGTVEEGLLRVAEQLVGDIAKLRRHDVLRLTQFDQPRLERLTLRLQRRDFGAGRIPVGANGRKITPETLGIGGTFRVLCALCREILHRDVALALHRIARAADQLRIAGFRPGDGKLGRQPLSLA